MEKKYKPFRKVEDLVKKNEPEFYKIKIKLIGEEKEREVPTYSTKPIMNSLDSIIEYLSSDAPLILEGEVYKQVDPVHDKEFEFNHNQEYIIPRNSISYIIYDERSIHNESKRREYMEYAQWYFEEFRG